MLDVGRILDSPWTWLLAALGLLAGIFFFFFDLRIHWGDPRGAGGAEEIEALAERDDTNLLFVLIDTLRSDRMSGYGYERETSPTLDMLAERGVRFARTQAQSSWTKASMASLWTGLYPARVGVTGFAHGTPEEAVLPAEILKDAGFRTVGLWRNGWVDPAFGFGQGFDVYHRPRGAPPSPLLRRENPTVQLGGTDEDAFAAATEFLRVFGDERWFLYLHLMDVHEYLYDTESALFGSGYGDVYDNAIRRVDELLGGFLLHLAQEGWLENTVIVIASDHGEAFRERGFEGHARRVYRESTEVPWIVSLPFVLDPGVVVETRARNVDIWPTILDLLGLPPMPETDGESQVPNILAAARGTEAAEDTLDGISHLNVRWGTPDVEAVDTVAVVEGPFRFVLSPNTSGIEESAAELFDQREDPLELQNVLEEHPEVAKRLRERAMDYLENSEVPWEEGNPHVELDEMQLNLLRALGYQVP